MAPWYSIGHCATWAYITDAVYNTRTPWGYALWEAVGHYISVDRRAITQYSAFLYEQKIGFRVNSVQDIGSCRLLLISTYLYVIEHETQLYSNTSTLMDNPYAQGAWPSSGEVGHVPVRPYGMF